MRILSSRGLESASIASKVGSVRFGYLMASRYGDLIRSPAKAFTPVLVSLGASSGAPPPSVRR
jgi:hypothetical protein